MQRLSCILSLCMLLGASVLSAQTDVDGQAEDIIDALQERVPGKGTVVVRGPDALRNMLGKRLHGEGVEKTDSTAFLIVHKCFPVITSVNPRMRLSGKKKKLRNFSLMSRLM